MKNFFWIFLFVCLCSCKQLSDNSLMVDYDASINALNIKNFSWGYGAVQFNSFHGDFDKLDKEVYDLLKDKTGSCDVYMQDNSTDKYGNKSDHKSNIGSIDINELNKYRDWTYWQKEHGIRSLLYKKYIQNNNDTVTIDTTTTTVTNTTQPIADVTQTVKSSPSENLVKNSTTQQFSIDQLYPTGQMPPTSESERFVITGTIDKIKFNDGVFSLITVDGDKVVMMFDPDHMEQSELQRFSSALVYGNKIKCVGTNSGESIYALLAAKITTQ